MKDRARARTRLLYRARDVSTEARNARLPRSPPTAPRLRTATAARARLEDRSRIQRESPSTPRPKTAAAPYFWETSPLAQNDESEQIGRILWRWAITIARTDESLATKTEARKEREENSCPRWPNAPSAPLSGPEDGTEETRDARDSVQTRQRSFATATANSDRSKIF